VRGLDPERRRILGDMGITVWAERSAGALETEVPPEERGDEARDQRIARFGWEEIELAVRACEACALHRSRTNTVFGVGDRRARWMIIGEAPGQNEDRQGEPFVGRAGALLNAMLAALGLARDSVFIANTLKCRPPGNRDPSHEETAFCNGSISSSLLGCPWPNARPELRL
jgi:DNA polymerase